LTRLLLILLLANFWLVGCSPLAKVSSNTNAIREEAQVLIDHGQATGDREVVTRAQRINDLAADTHSQLSGLEDKVPAWLTTLWMAALAVVVVGVVVLLWQTGLGTAVRIAIGWLPVPRSGTPTSRLVCLIPTTLRMPASMSLRGGHPIRSLMLRGDAFRRKTLNDPR